MLKEKNAASAPDVFYVLGDIHPVEMRYLCEYPYHQKGVYAVYLNTHSKLPERVHLPSIAPIQLNKDEMCLKVLSLHEFKGRQIASMMTQPDVKK